MQELLLVIAAVTALSTVAISLVSFLWFRKMRDSLVAALTQSVAQQVAMAQNFGDALNQVQDQQRHYEQQLQTLAQANGHLRQGLATIASQLHQGTGDASRVEPTIH